MHRAQPQARFFASGGLDGIFAEELLEVRGAVSAWVEAGKEVEEGPECGAIRGGGFERVSQGERMQEFPGRSTKLGPGIDESSETRWSESR